MLHVMTRLCFLAASIKAIIPSRSAMQHFPHFRMVYAKGSVPPAPEDLMMDHQMTLVAEHFDTRYLLEFHFHASLHVLQGQHSEGWAPYVRTDGTSSPDKPALEI